MLVHHEKHWKLLVKSRLSRTSCRRLSFHHEKYHPRLCAAYVHYYYFLWSTWHGMFSHTKFQIEINISYVVFLQCTWIEPHSSSLTNVENLTSNFGQSVQICCREKEKEENNDNCKAFCVTRKRKKLINEQLIILYSPSNTLCSSIESAVQIKHFKHHTFTGMCSLFTWFNLYIVNFY